MAKRVASTKIKERTEFKFAVGDRVGYLLSGAKKEYMFTGVITELEKDPTLKPYVIKEDKTNKEVYAHECYLVKLKK